MHLLCTIEHGTVRSCHDRPTRVRSDRRRHDTMLTDRQQKLCTTSSWDFGDLRALYVNCTLKPSPTQSHTQGLMDVSIAIMEANGVTVDTIRFVDHDVAPGVNPDMREHGAASDEWPALYERVQGADILVVGTPIWLGEKSSVCTHLIERLYGNSAELNEHGQYAYYGKVGGCLVTGNEDGVKHCSMSVLYGLQHLGYVIPPLADAGWIGEAGPGPSYLDPGSGGPDNDFTNRNTTFMTWNLLHLARMVKDAGGVPAHGNQRALWEAGCRFDFANPDYR
jgi:multimeric flavodoxin WrbA